MNNQEAIAVIRDIKNNYNRKDNIYGTPTEISNALDLAIQALQSYQWTPDSDSRPVGIYVPVLRQSYTSKKHYKDYAYYDKDIKSWAKQGYEIPMTDNVTHYFILPPVPKGGEL